MVEEVDPKNQGEDFFHITLTNLGLTDLLEHQYAAIRMTRVSADSSDNMSEIYQELSDVFKNKITEANQDSKSRETSYTVTLNGPKALYLHRAHISIIESAKQSGQDREGRKHHQYALEVQQEIERAGGLSSIKLLQEKIQEDYDED